MNETLNESMKSVSQSRIALWAAVVALLSLVSAACIDDAVDETAAEVADVEVAASADDADVTDQKAKAGLLDHDCSVQPGGWLYCGNEYFAPIYASPARLGDPVDRKLTTHSWFNCWAYSLFPDGSTRTWYHTQGDLHGNWGFMHASDVFTPPGFDENPDRYGLHQCLTDLPSGGAHR